ncbi:hypothetical protein [Streptomyces sp. NPDC054975]
MSLTSMLQVTSSPLRVFLARELPETGRLRTEFRARLALPADVVAPAVPEGTTVPWSTLGTAIDHRLRLALTNQDPHQAAVASGISLAGRPEFTTEETARTLTACGRQLAQHVRDLASRHQLDDRSLPLTRAADVEEEIARACYLTAQFEAVYRRPDPHNSPLFQQARPGLTLKDLLKDVPDFAVDDLAAMAARADTALASFRARTPPHTVTLAPTFTGSNDVGGADADWLADGTLVDVKATIRPAALPLADIYQLAGYLLLDYHDDLNITDVGWYSARAGAFAHLTTAEFLRLLGARHPLHVLRERLALLLRPTTPAIAPGQGALPAVADISSVPSRAPEFGIPRQASARQTATAPRPGRSRNAAGSPAETVIVAFRDAMGHWHPSGAADGPPPDAAVLQHTPRPGQPGADSPFAGQTLHVRLAPLDAVTDLAPTLYQLIDGRRMPATWQVHELLDDPYPPATPPAPARPASPARRVEITHEGHHYQLTLTPQPHGQSHATILVLSPGGEILSSIDGPLSHTDLQPISDLLRAAAQLPPPGAHAALPANGDIRATRNGQPWTTEDLDRLAAYHAAGTEPAQTARHLNRTERSVRFKLHQLRLAPFPADQITPPAQPLPAAEPAYSVEEIRRTHPRAYQRWTPEEDARLAERHTQGASLPELIEEFGRNEGAITSRLAVLRP